MEHVYVQAPDGQPLMPTKRFGKVRRLLKEGKASVVYATPFTIRLKEEPSGRITQDVTLGIDPGRTNIGTAAVKSDGKCLFRGKLESRNCQIRKLMDDRRAHRRASRRGERLARKRLARKYGTVTDRFDISGRMLPGYEKPLMLKDIINTESRFNNRKRPKGWLTPSARQLVLTHVSMVRLLSKILPVSGVVMEINRFAFMELEAGHRLFGETFQNGKLKGYLDVHDAVYDIQKGKCLFCGEHGIEHYHHLIPKHLGGSDTMQNMAGLCLECHTIVHTVPGAKDQLKERKEGLRRRYDGVSLLNTAIPFIAEQMQQLFPESFYPVTGMQTAAFREEHGLEKDHDIDAYAIACTGAQISGSDPGEYTCGMKQYRNHDRARIKSQTERTYLIGEKTVAANRHRRLEQPEKKLSLDEWYKEAVHKSGKQEADRMRSQLRVKKSTRRYNDLGRCLPGSLFSFKGKTYVKTGQITNGEYFRALGEGKTNFPSARCSILRNGGGILFG